MNRPTTFGTGHIVTLSVHPFFLVRPALRATTRASNFRLNKLLFRLGELLFGKTNLIIIRLNMYTK